jgi:hypothetical protein
MDAQRAFDRFEKSGGGIVPVALLAALTIAATLGVFHAANQFRESQAIPVLVMGNLFSKSMGCADSFDAVPEDAPQYADLHAQREEMDQLFPSPTYEYVGMFAPKFLAGFHLYLDAKNRLQVIVKRFKDKEGKKPGNLYTVFTSFTADDRIIRTLNREISLARIPWLDTQLVSSEGNPEEIVAALRSKHLFRVNELALQELTPENILSINREQATRAGLWLMEQAPLSVSRLEDLVGNVWGKRASEQNKNYFLIGFCDGAAEEFDRMAIDAYLNRVNEEDRSEEAKGLFALHAMSNRFHLVSTLVPTSDAPRSDASKKERADWLKSALAEPVSPPSDLERFMESITTDDPMVLLGEIDKPFPAKIYQRTSQKK